MPTTPPSPCRTPGCIKLGAGGYCTDHARQREREYQIRRGSAYSRGYTHDWQRARLMYIKRHPLCIHCMERGEYTPAEHVDHIIPHRGDRERFWDERNWQALCPKCHGIKTAKEDGRWGDLQKGMG